MINRDTLADNAVVWALTTILIFIGSINADAQQFREVDDYGWSEAALCASI
ncbi:MAG: hypothetical protein KFH87_12135 [Bacteroidetes bacterium]|nr:hypothetical protein [Bacteroidota bacterium]